MMVVLFPEFRPSFFRKRTTKREPPMAAGVTAEVNSLSKCMFSAWPGLNWLWVMCIKRLAIATSRISIREQAIKKKPKLLKLNEMDLSALMFISFTNMMLMTIIPITAGKSI